LIFAGPQAPLSQRAALRAAGVTVVDLPDIALDGRAIVEALGACGYGRVYSIAGPRVTHALLAADVVARLYITLAQLALGGLEFDTLTLGGPLALPARFVLYELYYDAAAPEGAGQLFASFDRGH
jgi:riboflavin biosynthesis pyrimidine reductase